LEEHGPTETMKEGQQIITDYFFINKIIVLDCGVLILCFFCYPQHLLINMFNISLHSILQSLMQLSVHQSFISTTCFGHTGPSSGTTIIAAQAVSL
jgi:hypothetical protein